MRRGDHSLLNKTRSDTSFSTIYVIGEVQNTCGLARNGDSEQTDNIRQSFRTKPEQLTKAEKTQLILDQRDEKYKDVSSSCHLVIEASGSRYVDQRGFYSHRRLVLIHWRLILRSALIRACFAVP
jgi:hypothetical protein